MGTRRNLTSAREFGRLLQPIHDLQPADEVLPGNTVLMVLDVNEIDAAGQPKKVTISGLANSVSPYIGTSASAVPKSLTIATPRTNDSFTIFRTDAETTISSVIALVSGSNPSVSYEIRYGFDRSSSGLLAIIPDTVTNTTTGDSATVQNQPIPANSYVWLVVTSVSGTVSELNVTLAF